MSDCDVAIVGAGPYGLSLAAHLRAAGVDYRIFGNPMEFWLQHMPKGMHLKSEGFASSLYDPESKFTLEAYCAERGLPYADIGLPVPLEVFAAYGLEFQRRLVPDLERQKVASVRRASRGFGVTLENGESFTANRVVIAVGLTYFASVPPVLASLPEGLVSHSSDRGPIDELKGKEVVIVGAGASAIDLAAVLHQAGAKVDVLSRGPKFLFQSPPPERKPSRWDRLRNPVTGIGLGWRLFCCAHLPLVFKMMPEAFRMEKVRTVLGPAPCWFTREQVVGKVGLHVNTRIESAGVKDGRVHLQLSGGGGTKTMAVDHVIAATGYKYDVRSLEFLDNGIVESLKRVGTLPALSSHFESSLANLYFVGITAAHTFGPLLRFAFGAGFAAPRLSRHLHRTASRAPSPASATVTVDQVAEQETAAAPR
jgi:thioredoxin reductase